MTTRNLFPFTAALLALLVISPAAHAVTAVTLNEPTNVTATTVDLSWTENQDQDFDRYEMHKSITQNFTPDQNTLDATIYNQMQTTYQVTGLTPSTTYYFKVRVVGFMGDTADSNEIQRHNTELGWRRRRPNACHCHRRGYNL